MPSPTTGPRLFVLSLLALAGAQSSAYAQDFSVPFSTEPPASLSVGDTVSISYDLENVSGTAAGQFSVGFVIQNTAATEAYLLYEDFVSSLGGFGSTTRTMTFTVPSGYDGLWIAGLIADPWDDLIETDENNNVYVFSTMVTIGGGGGGGAISVTSETLPNAQVGSTYSATLRQSGATSPNWYVSAGSLPSGLSLSSAGEIFGSPTTAGTFSFSATAEQAGLTSGTGSFSITVLEGGGGGAISVSPTSLPEARVGVPFMAQLSASGGTPPYGYQVVSGAPSWLITTGAGTDAGRMSGTPDAVGNYSMLVFVVDSENVSGMATVNLNVAESGPLSVATSLPAGVTNKNYAGDLVSGGIPPYSVQVTNGALPAGLSVDGATGALFGVPTTAGTFTFDIAVGDSAGASATGSFTVDVTEEMVLYIASSEIVVYSNAEAMAQLVAMGGVPPYSWSMLGGTLPPGLSFDAAEGRIIGRPTELGQETATFMVTDAEGTSFQSDVVVRVAIFIPQGSGARGGDRDSGCACVTPTGGASWWLFGFAALVLLRRRR
ncbi:MAG: putative Ig domain-containing protein [Deltaproteobacteria bacterium]